MTEHDPRWMYRQMIDAMVVCCSGPGQVSAERIRIGVWNENAAADDVRQTALNRLVTSLDADQREALAVVMAEEFASGMFNALEVLQAAQLAPFEVGYEGDPSDDFLGRLDGWEWPVA
jgi:hypothetical protein